jgi:hypothetical protein
VFIPQRFFQRSGHPFLKIAHRTLDFLTGMNQGNIEHQIDFLSDDVMAQLRLAGSKTLHNLGTGYDYTVTGCIKYLLICNVFVHGKNRMLCLRYLVYPKTIIFSQQRVKDGLDPLLNI